MKKIDQLALDGYALTTFITVLEEASVSRAADRLGVSQSAVSHTLEKLRQALQDPLFVRIGRGIEPTAKAHALRPSVELILDQLKALTEQRQFDPRAERMEFTVATNDFPLALIFPKLLREISEEGIDLRVRFIPAGIPRASMLRASRYRLLITPTPPDDPDLLSESLVTTKLAIFYDSKVEKPPTTRKQYYDRKFVDVKFSDTESATLAMPIADAAELKSATVTVPNFGSLAQMIVGTDRITTQVDVMKLGLLRGLDCAPLPFSAKSLDLFLMWHKREQDDPAHYWFRQRIIDSMKSIISDSSDN